MQNFLVNFIILSCLFNIPYYWFNWEETMQEYVEKLQKSMIEEMERRDPFHPFLKDLHSKPIGDIYKNLDNKPILKLIRDMLFFPINFILMALITVDKLMKSL